jgi:hypothetical protein
MQPEAQAAVELMDREASKVEVKILNAGSEHHEVDDRTAGSWLSVTNGKVEKCGGLIHSPPLARVFAACKGGDTCTITRRFDEDKTICRTSKKYREVQALNRIAALSTFLALQKK